MEIAIIGLLIFESIALLVIVLLLINIKKKIDMSEFWKELLDAKIKNMVYKKNNGS